MDQFKNFLNRYFEAILIIVLLLAVELIFFYAFSKVAFLNFFYLPVLLAGFYVGKRSAIFTSIASVLLVILFYIISPNFTLAESQSIKSVLDLSVWAFFLVLSAILVGTLHEQKEVQIKQQKMAYVGILEILSKYLESYDLYTQGHSVRVAEYASKTAIAMRLSRQEVENIRVAALLHDIGKVEVSLDLLQKSADLTEAEKDFIDEHSEKGAKLLGLVGTVLDEAIPIVEAHHKSYYENDNINEQLPLGARVVAVTDAYDAMITDRPYQAAIPPWQAFAEIEKLAGKKFDPKVVKAFKGVLIDTLGQEEFRLRAY